MRCGPSSTKPDRARHPYWGPHQHVRARATVWTSTNGSGRKDAVLMRDMTDTMYNPTRWPFVSHFTGTDLIIDRVERHVCL